MVWGKILGDLVANKQPISTKDTTSKCFLDMLSLMSEFETNSREELQINGIKGNKHTSKVRQSTIDRCKKK